MEKPADSWTRQNTVSAIECFGSDAKACSLSVSAYAKSETKNYLKAGLFRFFIAVTMLIPVFSDHLIAASLNGDIVSSEKHNFPDYNELPNWMKQKFSEAAYAKEFNNSEWELLYITYLSGELKVKGFLYKPKNAARKFPAIVYNRPGFGEPSKISNNNFRVLYEMYKCTKEGFVVIASQYRGVDGGDGKDEIGGADLNDVKNLLPLLTKLEYVDVNHLYMWGTSRGATMTLQAVRDQFPVKAVAVVGTPTDWNRQLEHNKTLGKDYWPDFDKRKDEHIRIRSAVQWPERLDVPMLFIHGTADAAVDVQQVYSLTSKLQEKGKLYEVIIYANDDHLVTRHLDEKIEKILNWFKTPPRKLISLTLRTIINQQGIAAALHQYDQLKAKSADQYEFGEDDLLTLGYNLFFESGPEVAKKIFELFTKEYANSVRGYEGMSFVYEQQKNMGEAIKVLNQALAKDPQNIRLRNKIDQLKQLQAK